MAAANLNEVVQERVSETVAQTVAKQMPARVTRLLVLFGLTVVLLYLCYLLIQPFVNVIAWALTFAIIAYPLNRRLERIIGNRTIAAGLVTFLMALICVVILGFVVFNVTQQASDGVEQVQQSVEEGSWRRYIKDIAPAQAVLGWMDQNVNVQRELQNAFRQYLSNVTKLVSGSFWAVAGFLITFFSLFFFLRDKDAALQSLRSLVPLPVAETDEIIETIGNSVHGTVYGVLIVSILQGSLCGLMFWILGLPNPVLWSIVMSFLSILPTLGAFVIWGPAVVYLILQGSMIKAGILAAWGALAVGCIDNLLYPMLVGRKVRLHTLAVFFGVLGGVSVFGTCGIVLGPAIVAVADAVLDLLRRRLLTGKECDQQLYVPVTVEER